MRKLLKILFILAIICLVGFASFYYFLQRPGVQTYLTQKVTEILSTQLGTKVNVGGVNIKFFRRLVLTDVYIEDKNQDTLLYADYLFARFGVLNLLRKKIELKRVDLKGAKIYFHRRPGEENYNYDFLTFGSKTNNIDATNKKSRPYDIILNDIHIEDLDFNVLDELNMRQFRIAFNDFELSAKDFNMARKEIRLKKVELDKAKIVVRKLFNPLDSLNEKTIPKAQSINNDDWHILSDRLVVKESVFQNVNENKPKAIGGMDYNDLYVSDINIQLHNVEILCDTIFADIKSLSAKEKSGFEIKEMRSKARVSTTLVECKNLDLITPNSHITNYYSMSYSGFPDFLDYVNRVKMTGNFKQSKVALKDINYFAKGHLNKIAHNTLYMTGNVSGTVNNLKGRNLAVQLGKQSSFYGEIDFKGLPDFNETFITLNVEKVKTNYNDLKTLYPYLDYPTDLKKMGLATFKGEFIGFINDFVANGSLETDIGDVNSDINFKIDPVTNLAAYSGHFATEKFDLGKWFDRPESLGEITLNTRIKGSGIKLEDIEAQLDGSIKTVTVQQHEYKDVVMNGDFKDKFFKGLMTINDKDLDLDFEGKIDLNDSVPVFQFSSNLNKANLKPLNLTKENYSISSTLKLDFTGINVDKFVGYAGLFNTKITKDTVTYALDTFELSANPLAQGEKELTLNSDIVKANFNGQFTYKNLPLALQELFYSYFQPENKEKTDFHENFRFKATIDDSKNFTQLALPSFKNIKGVELEGSFNSGESFVGLIGQVAGLTYNDFSFKNIRMSSFSGSKSVDLLVTVDSLLRKDSLLVDGMNLTSTLKQDSVLFDLQLQDEDCENHAELNGLLRTDLKSFNLKLLPSALHIGDQKWSVSQGNSIKYQDKKLDIKNLVFKNTGSEVELKTFLDPIGGNHLSVFLRDIDLNKVMTPLHLASKTEFDGIINGSLAFINVLDNPKLIASLKVDSFGINKETLGQINITSDYQPDNDRVGITASLVGQSNHLAIDGFYSISGDDNLNFQCSMSGIDLKHLDPFIKKDVSKIGGTVSGNFSVTGNIKKPLINGRITGRNVQAKVNYLNALYSFESADFRFTDNKIDLGEITVNDEDGNTAIATGHIYLRPFKNIDLDINIETKNFTFLNTNYTTSEPYYGKVLADGLVLIQGPVNDVKFLISAKTNPGTQFSIDVTRSRDVDQYTFYRFINNEENKKVGYKTKIKGLQLDMDVQVTPDATVSLILNQQQGGVIKGTGAGDINLNLNKEGEVSIVGNYKIEDGDYLFSMQNVITKKFKIDKGSTIMWSGDVENATLDISAVYKLRATPYDLISDMVTTTDEIQKAKNRVPVYLYLYITGSLLNPDINFDIAVPDADPLVRTSLETKFQALKNDPNAFNIQVVGLLVLNRFIPERTSTAEPNITSDVNNSVSEFLSNQLSIYLSDWISEFITDVQLDINYRTYQNAITGTQNGIQNQTDFENRQELQLALTKSFFNDRISVDVGGNFDFGQNNTQASNSGTDASQRASNIAGDFEIKYSITPDGRIKVKAFRKGEYDIFQNRNKNKTGIGISWDKDFDTVKDFFVNRRRKKSQRRSEEPEGNQ